MKSFSLIHAGLLPRLLDFLNTAIDWFCALRRLSLNIHQLSRAPLTLQGSLPLSLPRRSPSKPKPAFLKSYLVVLLLLILSYRVLNTAVSRLLQGRMPLPFISLTRSSLLLWSRFSRTSPLLSSSSICLKKLPPACTQAYYSSSRFWGS